MIGELDRLVVRGVPGARAAAKLASRFPVRETTGRGDLGVLEAAVGPGTCVVTADRALAERLRALGVDVLTPRDRHRLELWPGRAASQPSVRRPPRARIRSLDRGNG